MMFDEMHDVKTGPGLQNLLFVQWQKDGAARRGLAEGSRDGEDDPPALDEQLQLHRRVAMRGR